MEPSGHGVYENVTFIEPKIEDYVMPVLATYHHIPIISVVYLAYVKYYGPRFMSEKKPFDLKRVITFYNLVQIAMNIYIIYLCCCLNGIRILDPWGHVCNPVTSVNNNPHVKEKILEALYYYYLNKLLDCLDTVFFVLRKKQSQVTFLHVYHHAIMIYSTWISFIILRDEVLIQFAALNSLIHVIMYTYYFLSSLGPTVQKYLWWKKYITTMQMAQFILALSMVAKLKLDGCNCTDGILYLWSFNIITLLVLFSNFYIQTYLNKRKE